MAARPVCLLGIVTLLEVRAPEIDGSAGPVITVAGEASAQP